MHDLGNGKTSGIVEVDDNPVIINCREAYGEIVYDDVVDLPFFHKKLYFKTALITKQKVRFYLQRHHQAESQAIPQKICDTVTLFFGDPY